ncbi:MAG TPA: hypothetical protein VNA31_06825, partial [bacterium]|nr:hypothetical protein [bacterium]
MKNAELPYQVSTDVKTWIWWVIVFTFSLSSIFGFTSVAHLEGFKSGLWFLSVILILGVGLGEAKN